MRVFDNGSDGISDHCWTEGILIVFPLFSFFAGLYRRMADCTLLPVPVSSLRTMSDHALRDIGLSRTELPAIAESLAILKAGGSLAERFPHETPASQ